MYALLKQYLQTRAAASEEEITTICKHFSPRQTARNEYLLYEGEVCRHYYFVNKGCLRLFTTTSEGVETTRYFAFEGSFGTALPSLIQQTPAFEFVQTIEPSQLLQISRADFFMLVDSVPAFARLYRQILERGFITAQKRIYGFQGLDALAKVKWALNYQPDFLLRVSNKMAASYLGITPSTLSRVKARL
jgi:CRP-like cAMP-binding protein